MAQFDTAYSLNNKLVLQAYQKKDLKSAEKNGIAFVQQKVAVHPLLVLMDARLTDGTVIKKGSSAYIKEETLHGQAWAAKPLQSSGIEGQFLVVDLSFVDFVVPAAE